MCITRPHVLEAITKAVPTPLLMHCPLRVVVVVVVV